ncbi:nucleotidyltransferase [uncultured Abiotrophia sp.]|uniref:nucleotidyltransferase domain-containing protein n=1 Tax=uncultured Abiotrophia sp. TaxID=316094 RepID=UPI00288B2BB9|nr:nucleotidyltransferase [uncultured Abiotrophia sp.]
MSIQSKLEQFHEKIKMSSSLKRELREKKGILLEILRKDRNLPSFCELEQGSYAMHTGVKPEEDQEYDIDVALRFSATKSEVEPLVYKENICEILKNHTEYGAEIKKSCVTVTYSKEGEAKFHVDLVVYTYEDKNDKDSQLYIAKGIDKESQKWEKADPKGLLDYIGDQIEEENEREQFRRVVKYIKKWRNLKFTNTGHTSPPSIGITLIALDNFKYCEDDDLSSLIHIVEAIVNKFNFVGWDGTRELYRIQWSLPTVLEFEAENDVFEKMTNIQMTDFKDKTEKFKRDLISVQGEVDENIQYKKLNEIFGDDFEAPDEKTTAKQQQNYIPSSSVSGYEI